MIEAINLCKKYEFVEANKDICFKIEEGEFVVILGASGAGKSTLMNILGGIETASSGQLIVDGENILEYTNKQLTNYRKDKIGFIFQFYNLIPNLTALENVAFAYELVENGIQPIKALELVGLDKRANNFPCELSGGEMQRVSIARAISKNPKILLCDEPTGALDFKTGIQVLKLLEDLCRETKKTVVVITHNSEIAKIADKVIKIADAKVEYIKMNDNKIDAEKLKW